MIQYNKQINYRYKKGDIIMLTEINNIPDKKISEINERIKKVLANEGLNAKVEVMYSENKSLNGFKVEVLSEK